MSEVDHIKELAETVSAISESGIPCKKYQVDGKEYEVFIMDVQDFEKFCNESVEDFIKRKNPKNSGELSNWMMMAVEAVLEKEAMAKEK